MDHAKRNQIDRQRQSDRLATMAERQGNISAQTAQIIAGMGQGKRPPLKRIDPNSPEGRAIAARYTD